MFMKPSLEQTQQRIHDIKFMYILYQLLNRESFFFNKINSHVPCAHKISN